jgi:SpoVK/Ycf46/Vps4 family AAA+-type ATPase
MPNFIKEIFNQGDESSSGNESEGTHTGASESSEESHSKNGVAVEADKSKRTADDRGQKGIDASEVDLDGSDPANSDDENDAISSDFITSPPDVDFDDVAGMEELKETLRNRVIEPIENPEEYEKYGLTVENGFLFHGPPGTGKTYISKALAGELGVNYAGVKGSDLISRFVGAGTENVAKLFEEARNNQPCMVFIDEIDAVAPERTGSGQHQMQTQMVNQLLEEIGAINDSDADIVVVGATNKPEEIDEAIKRSGRLTAEIEIGNPDADSRIAILDTHLDAPRADSLNLVHFGRMTEGLSAADMEQVAISAARNAMQRGSDVSAEDIEAGIEEVSSGS